MKHRQLTCIVCPRGCALTVALSEDGRVESVDGNFCPRGRMYAEKECTAPQRTVTTTVRCADGRVVAVKTKDPVPKERVFDVMAAINALHPTAPIRVGEELLADVAGTGVSVVATAELR